MSVSVYKVKKWIKMMTGKSISHVDQGIGKCYSKEEISGYYNDLTEKVLKRNDLGTEVPKSNVDTGECIFFSIEIFQYGLGAYDLYLLNEDESMLVKVKAAADWAVANQQNDGSWVTFLYENPEHPFSSMAQGEGISLLIRAYLALHDERYLECAKKALGFMFIPLEDGGTTKYEGEDVFFYECTEDPLILNGWIFSLWGVYDYQKFFKDEKSGKVLSATLLSLKKVLPQYDTGYWSMYEDGKRICSPFYHKLHIVQLHAMYEITEEEIYKRYADKWEQYRQKRWNRSRAFVKKAFQKVFE